jgi:hypothetical protein
MGGGHVSNLLLAVRIHIPNRFPHCSAADNCAPQQHDILSFEFSVLHVPAAEIAAAPKEGAYIDGMFLEGAGWDEEEVRLPSDACCCQ